MLNKDCSYTLHTTHACEASLNKQSTVCCLARLGHNRGIDSPAAPKGGSAQGKYRMSSSSRPFIERRGKGPSIKVLLYKYYTAGKVQSHAFSLLTPSTVGGCSSKISFVMETFWRVRYCNNLQRALENVIITVLKCKSFFCYKGFIEWSFQNVRKYISK